MAKDKVNQEKLNDALQIILSHLQDNSGEANIEYLKEATAALVQKKPLPVEHIPNNKLANKGVPDEHIIPNNKLANSLTDEDNFSLSEFDMRVSKRGAKREIKNATVISYEGSDIEFQSKNPFTEYDRQVYEGIVSIWVTGTSVMSPAMIYRAMNGLNSEDVGFNAKISESIMSSIRKMRFINVKTNAKEELEQRKVDISQFDLELDDNGFLERNLLYAETATIPYRNSSGAGIAHAIKIVKVPVLYEYSRALKQVLTVPSELLSICDENNNPIRNSEQRIVVKGYLLRRIKVMQGKTQQSSRIKLSAIYSLFPKKLNRTQQKRIKDYAIEVLQYWQRKNFIKDFELIKKHGGYYAFDIK